jgi:hypothetical protein|tara:strand:+ start:265 stop:447 length:183 start_codon:yes stop_codon:yes gene_type:complete
MINATYSTIDSPITKLNSKKVQIAKVCHEIDEVMDKLGDENYCPYEDLEAIHEKLQKMTD